MTYVKGDEVTTYHYVAHLKVERVDHVKSPGLRVLEGAARDVSEIASFAIKADSLANLRTKLSAHVTLIDE
ncbi:hypothetical protein OU415_02485 [Saccharopolyspora sp. WRP15-2]|uniref:Uncharacterized protein n=1 Tax=Saccharopolyspora oryzae TaxID=2997343 RepID=A0ABT4URF0_9PSEU|nr:hypothetical protein [Saccharopolyspora oryzae]MDA3624285.1 hypothetical protein [Saccharopolyspora oryzae]